MSVLINAHLSPLSCTGITAKTSKMAFSPLLLTTSNQSSVANLAREAWNISRHN